MGNILPKQGLPFVEGGEQGEQGEQGAAFSHAHIKGVARGLT